MLTLITVGLAYLLQLSASVRLDQSTQQHVFQARVSPTTHIFTCPAYLQQRRVLKIQATACTSLINLLGCRVPLVTLRGTHRCAHADTGTPVLICDTCRWTSRDERFPRRQIKPCIVSQAVPSKLFCQSKIHQGGFIGHSNAKITSICLPDRQTTTEVLQNTSIDDSSGIEDLMYTHVIILCQ